MQDSLPAGGLRLYREGVEPSGSLRKVSGYITILLSRTCPVARVVYAKRPFGGPDAVLAYLSRYTRLRRGFHRIRHYGLFANGRRAENLARARQLLNVPAPQNALSDTDSTGDGEPRPSSHPCPCCGGRMIIIEIFECGCSPRYHPTVPNRVDSS